MTTPAIWDTALWGDASWDTLLVQGAITERADAASGGIAVINNVGGLVTESPDDVAGEVLVIYTLSGDVVEGEDIADGEVQLTIPVSGEITEAEDIAEGGIADFTINYVSGAIKEKKDVVAGQIGIIVRLSGAVVEGEDIARGNLLGPKGVTRGGGWAPQFYYERDWEKKPEVYVEEIEEEIYEPDPEALFIPTALPIDPAVARMIEVMMRTPDPVDQDDDDMEALLMHL